MNGMSGAHWLVDSQRFVCAPPFPRIKCAEACRAAQRPLDVNPEVNPEFTTVSILCPEAFKQCCIQTLVIGELLYPAYVPLEVSLQDLCDVSLASKPRPRALLHVQESSRITFVRGIHLWLSESA